MPSQVQFLGAEPLVEPNGFATVPTLQKLNALARGLTVNGNYATEAYVDAKVAAGQQGPQGNTGATGPVGPMGPAGPGVATGGTTGQVLYKTSNTDYATAWETLTPALIGAQPAFGTQTANYVYAGPASGAAALPTFRGLVPLDIPDISATYLTVSAAAAGYQPLDGDLTSLAAASSVAIYYRAGVSNWQPVTIGAGLTFTTGTLTASGSGGTVTSVGLTSTNLTIGGSASPITGAGSFTVNLPTTAVTAGSYGSTSQVATFTVDAFGRLTAAANATITPASIGAQPLDARLTAESLITTTGMQVQTGAATFARRTLTSPNNGLTWSGTGDGVAGNPAIILANDAAAVEGLTGTGIAVRTGTDAWSLRTLVVSARLTLSNADGSTGNPSFDLATSGVTAATYGSATQSAVVTFDTYGRATVASSVTITPAFASLTGTPTTIAGYGITDAQPLDADLTSLAAAAATNAIYYRSAANTWNPVTIGSGISLTAGTLAATGSGGTVTSVGLTSTDFTVIGSPVTTSGNITANLVTQAGVTAGSFGSSSVVPVLTINSKGVVTAASTVAIADMPVTLTGDVTGTGTGSVATTLTNAQPAVHTWALTQTFTVSPVMPTPTAGDSSTKGATTAFVVAGFQPLDGDLTSLATASATGALYYRSAANTWSTVTIGSGVSFSGGTLAATGSGGTVTSVGLTSTTLTITGSPITGSGSFTANLPSSGVTAASYGSSSSYTTFTVDIYGRLTAAASVALGTLAFINSPVPIANGGTGATTAGAARTNLAVNVTGYGALTGMDANSSVSATAALGIYKHTVTLTASRNLNFTAVGVYDGRIVRVVRTSTGSFVLNVMDSGTGNLLKALATNTWCDIAWNAGATTPAWELIGYGTL